MARKIETYMCSHCSFVGSNDFDTCPACGWSDKEMKYMWPKSSWVAKGPAPNARFCEWMEKQPNDFTSRVWLEGYGESRMQEKNNIIDFPDVMAPKIKDFVVNEK